MSEIQKKPKFDPSKPFQDASAKPAFDPNKPFNEVSSSPNMDALKEMLREASFAMDFIDSYTGAPPRKLIGELQDVTKKSLEQIKSSNKPLSLPQKISTFADNIGSAFKSGLDQFGQPTNTAPSPLDITSRVLPSEPVNMKLYMEPGTGIRFKEPIEFKAPSPAGLSAPFIGMGVDLTNFAGPMLKAGGYAAEKTIPAIGEALTGIPARETRTYMQNLPKINAMSKKYGQDISSAADDVRRQYTADIQTARTSSNSAIEAAKLKYGNEPVLSIAPVIDSLEASKLKLDPDFQKAEIEHINSIIDQIKNASEGGKMSVGKMYDTNQKLLAPLTQGSYTRSGQIFPVSSDTQRAVREAQFQARQLVNQAAPEIKDANKTLSTLRQAEKRSKNLISPQTPDGALLSLNQRNRNTLSALERITGTPMVQQADELAALRRFSSPDFLPIDATGKSGTRLALGLGLGAIADKLGVAPHGFGSFLGGAATSPLALKAAINAGAMGGKIAGVAMPAYRFGNTFNSSYKRMLKNEEKK